MSGNKQTEAEARLAGVLIQALDLEDITPENIVPDAPLFDLSHPESLGLDSIDALEISLAIIQNYGVQLKADDENNKAIFFSLRTLQNYIDSQKA